MVEFILRDLIKVLLLHRGICARQRHLGATGGLAGGVAGIRRAEPGAGRRAEIKLCFEVLEV